MVAPIGKEQKEEIHKLVKELSLTEEDTRRSIDAFTKYCKKGQDRMNKEDFKAFLETLGIDNYTDNMIEALFLVLDTNADKEVSAVEFMRYFLLMTELPTKTKLKILFNIIDRDESGSIELSELKTYYNKLARSRSALMSKMHGTSENDSLLTDEEIERMFQKMKPRHNQKVTLSEFIAYSESHGPHLLRLLDAFWETDVSDKLSVKILKKSIQK